MAKPQTIAEILKKTLEKSQFQVPIEREKILENWSNLVGEILADQAKPKAFKQNTLVVEVSHPTWMQEMHFFKEKILNKIHENFPEAKVKELRFTLKA